MKTVAVIGAGLSGLTVASQLSHYFDITVFDKSRGVSGRMSTRTALPYRFDHGAQYFKVREPQFARFIADAIEQDLVAEWHARVVDLSAEGIQDVTIDQPWYVAKPTMTALNKSLAEGLSVQLNQRIESVKYQDSIWSLRNEAGEHVGDYDFLISAIPLPQLEQLLPEIVGDDDELKNVKMSGCFSLMIGCSEAQLPDFDFARVTSSPVGIISQNSAKPGRDEAPSLLVQSTNEWAEQMLEMPLAEVEQHLTRELSSLMGINYQSVEYRTLHRWRYAFVNQALGRPFYRHGILPFAACGDWCMGARIESAYMSGFDLATELLKESIS